MRQSKVMKQLFRDAACIGSIYLLWKLFLIGISSLAPHIISLRQGFLGPTPWANMDGVHYLSIAENGYVQFEQAFFPLYPLIIQFISRIANTSYALSALIISNASFFVGLLVFYRLAKLTDRAKPLRAVILLLVFPTSFFFAATYTESLYFLFATVVIFATKKHRFVLAGILGFLASLTRLFGVFLLVISGYEYIRVYGYRIHARHMLSLLLIPLGLVAYMIYLQYAVGDPIAFIHAQPAFGAGRTGGTIVLPPQVLWRYGKILTTVVPDSPVWAVAFFELTAFLFGMWVLYRGWRAGWDASYLFYSGAVLVVPALTGTLSSVPRYMLCAIPLFLILSSFSSRKFYFVYALVSISVFIMGAALYLQGYFVG